MSKGRFGVHGGQYMPETLMNAVIELEKAYNHYKDDPEFNAELTELLNSYAGRPSRLYFAEHMTNDLGGAKIYLKREDLNHTGAHKINNVLGQALLAKKMGKTRLIAETGAGQHGVATATAAALMGMECVVFMGVEDTERQALNVYRMRLLGAEVIPVTTGTGTLKDACSAAFREWTSRIDDTHYCLGSCMGPHPFPTIVRDFQAVISKEIKELLLGKRRAAFIPFSALCSYFIFGVSFRCRVDLRYSSSVWLTTELAVLENASPNVRQQAGSSGRDTTPGQPNACITSSCEMVTPSPLRTNAMMRVSSRKL